MTLLRRLATRLRAIDPRIVDAVVALVVTAAMAATPAFSSQPVNIVPLLVMSIALAWRRRWPLGVLIVVFVCLLVAGRSDGRIVEVVAVTLAVFTAALHARARRLTAVVVLTMAVVASVLGAQLPVPNWMIGFVLLGSVWVAGDALRRRELRADALADRARSLEHERDEALAAERARIARELHDVVTHGVSVMVLQAGAARQQLRRDPDRAETLLHSVEEGGREALDELRRFLGLLADHTDGAPLTPQPGIDQVEALVERVRATGLPVELAVEGEPRPLPSGIALAAYRVVQEGLTNALKHGQRPHTRVLIRYAPRMLDLEIVDDGRAAAVGPPGHGLLGMRERVSLYGGTVSSGPRPERGYELRVRLPLDAAAP